MAGISLKALALRLILPQIGDLNVPACLPAPSPRTASEQKERALAALNGRSRMCISMLCVTMKRQRHYARLPQPRQAREEL